MTLIFDNRISQIHYCYTAEKKNSRDKKTIKAAFKQAMHEEKKQSGISKVSISVKIAVVVLVLLQAAG